MAAIAAAQPLHDGWVTADDVRRRLKVLGVDAKSQQVGAWLSRMSRVDAPWVERRKLWEFPEFHYRVTRYGRTDIHNRLPGLRPDTPWLDAKARDTNA